jgi:hypothetical protein
VNEQRTHMSQTQAPTGVVAARAAVRLRTAPVAALRGFCTPVFTTTNAGGIPTPIRRPPIE